MKQNCDLHANDGHLIQYNSSSTCSMWIIWIKIFGKNETDFVSLIKEGNLKKKQKILLTSLLNVENWSERLF